MGSKQFSESLVKHLIRIWNSFAKPEEDSSSENAPSQDHQLVDASQVLDQVWDGTTFLLLFWGSFKNMCLKGMALHVNFFPSMDFNKD